MAFAVVIVVATRKFDKYASFVTDRPGIMTRRKKHHVVLSEDGFLAIVHANTKRAGKYECDVWQNTTLGAVRSLEIVGPFRADVKGDARYRHALKLDCLFADQSVNIRRDRIEISDLHM